MKELGPYREIDTEAYARYMAEQDRRANHDREIEEIINGLLDGKTFVAGEFGATWSLQDCFTGNEEAEKALVALFNRPGLFRDPELTALYAAVAGRAAEMAETIHWSQNKQKVWE